MKRQKSVYEKYYNYEEPVKTMAGHRTLAINRGEKEKFLTVKLEVTEDNIIHYLEKKVIINQNSETVDILKEAVADAYKRLIAPAIERDIRNELTEKAEDDAIKYLEKIYSSF